MRFSVNEIVQTFDPWDLTIEIDGVDYKVRPLTLADNAALRSMASMSEDESYAYLASLFMGDPPDVRKLDQDQAMAMIGGILGYRDGLVKKNGPIAFERIKAQTEK